MNGAAERKTMGNNKKIGLAGEALAAEILKGKGYYVITRNFSCPYGEVDIIAVKDRVISFIEVKTRTSEEYGRPAEAVDLKKQRHIRNGARFFLSRYKRKYDAVEFHVMEIEVNHIIGLEV